MNLEIIYEDEEILVCYKPAGIATQTKRLGQQDMESILKNYRASKKETPYIGIVHRLDQPVEGIMVYAKTQKAAADLSRQVRERNIGKHYLALVRKTQESCVLAEQGELVDYIQSDSKKNISRVVTEQELQKNEQLRKDTKLAKLEYKRIMQNEELALYDVLLHTGRHHQIRLQFANAGCPLVGDSKYEKEVASADMRMKKEPLGLCSYRLEFIHPKSGESVDFTIKPHNSDMARFLDKGNFLPYIES